MIAIKKTGFHGAGKDPRGNRLKQSINFYPISQFMSTTTERSFFFLEKMDKGLALVPGMLGNAAGSFDRRNLGVLVMNSPFSTSSSLFCHRLPMTYMNQ